MQRGKEMAGTNEFAFFFAVEANVPGGVQNPGLDRYKNRLFQLKVGNAVKAELVA